MTDLWPYLSLLATIGVLLLLLTFTLGLFIVQIEEALEKRSKYLLAAVVSTFSVVLMMTLFAAMTILVVDQSEGRLHAGIAATLVGLVMLASGVRGAVQAAEGTIWTPAFRLSQVLLGLAVYIVIAVWQPGWLIPLAGLLLHVVQWFFGLPLLGWVVRFLDASSSYGALANC